MGNCTWGWDLWASSGFVLCSGQIEGLTVALCTGPFIPLFPTKWRKINPVQAKANVSEVYALPRMCRTGNMKALPRRACGSSGFRKWACQRGEALNFLLFSIATGIAAFVAYFGNGGLPAFFSMGPWAFPGFAGLQPLAGSPADRLVCRQWAL